MLLCPLPSQMCFLRQVEHAEDKFTKVATSSSFLAVQQGNWGVAVAMSCTATGWATLAFPLRGQFRGRNHQTNWECQEAVPWELQYLKLRTNYTGVMQIKAMCTWCAFGAVLGLTFNWGLTCSVGCYSQLWHKSTLLRWKMTQDAPIETICGWWFQICFTLTPTWRGRNLIFQILFKWF